jgi:RNA polymerase sigma-70 factor (ECF subfamily)
MLVDGLRRGDEGAFEALFRRYYQQVYRVAYRLVGSREEAEDLAQETFIKLHSHPLADGRAPNVGGWLYRVVTNLGYNTLRARSRQDRRHQRAEEVVEREYPAKEAEQDPAEVASRQEDRRLVRHALSLLSWREQACLILRSEGLSYAEIAAALGVAPGSVGTLLARAETALRRQYFVLLEGGQRQ